MDQRRLLRLPAATSSTTCEEGEELVEEPFERLIAEEQLLAYPLRRVLGADGHAQGQAQPRGARRDGQPPWEVWAERNGVPARSRRLVVAMLKLKLGDASISPTGSSRSGCHADDIEIGCGGTILHLDRVAAVGRGALGRPQRSAERAPRGARASAEAFLDGAADRPSSSDELPRRLLPVRRRGRSRTSSRS